MLKNHKKGIPNYHNNNNIIIIIIILLLLSSKTHFEAKMPTVPGRDPNCASTDVNVFCVVCHKKYKGTLYKNSKKYNGFDVSCRSLTHHLNNKNIIRPIRKLVYLVNFDLF